MNIQKLQNLWFENKERYLKAEKGSKGNEGFTKEFLTQIFGLSENNDGKIKFGTFRNQHGTGQKGRTADFVLYCSEKVIIPLEVEKLGNLEAGSIQILNYQSDLDTKYGILTDGLKWVFFYGKKTKVFDLEVEIFKNPEDFITFWQDYINSESFYQNYFSGNEQDGLFEIKYKVDENREKYFQSTTQIVHDFKTKLIQKGFTPKEGLFENTDKKATELAYSYLIQFILFKTLVDNKYLDSEYARYINLIKESLETKNYGKIIKVVKQITDTVGSNIYKPFFKDQDDINEQIKILLESLDDPEINDVTLFLDIIIYIDKYDFSGLGGDIFGYIYENYLKELYSDENKGQYFTDPNIAELMLVEMGWSVENLVEKIKNKEGLSLIDPACGSGTFLYSAVKTLIKAGQKANLESVKIINLVVENIVGFDVEEFPLYLAEMNILMRLLPLIYEDLDNPTPVEKRLKIFWTEDSLSEFTDISSYNQGLVRDQNTNPLFEPVPSQFHKFMRDEKDLKKLKEELLDTKRQKFDFVIANPPYIGYNESSKMGVKIIKEKIIPMSDVYGVNLNTAPGKIKKYSPKPNLYAYFLALANGLLKKDGSMCYIIPQTLLTTTDLDVLRFWLSNQMQLQKLITFQNNLFIDRGVKQTKKVATSSLVIVAKKI